MAPSPILDFPSQSSPLNKTVLILRGLAQTAPEEPVLASCTPAVVPLVSESPCSVETVAEVLSQLFVGCNEMKAGLIYQSGEVRVHVKADDISSFPSGEGSICS